MKQVSQFLIIVFFVHFIHADQPAIIQVPVADLVGDQFKTSQSSLPLYQALPYDTVTPQNANRLHQGLFNEQVTIIERVGDQLRIELPNIFYQTADGIKHSAFWTHAHAILPLAQLSTSDHHKIPQAISYHHPLNTKQSIVTLIKPWYCPVTRQTYSAGTRFVLASPVSSSTREYCVYVLDIRSKKMRIASLPHAYAITNKKRNNQEMRSLFVRILKSWARTPGMIPYVWGGCSYTQHYAYKPFKINKHPRYGESYQRPTIHDTPKTGFDCSGIIARTAQLVGMPFYYKNTTTIARYLPSLQKNEPVQDGDIIWVPGHVMVVSDVEKNLMIEAGSYSHGYGYIHELPLAQQFKGINTYADLKKAFFEKHPLIRLSNYGTDKQKMYRTFKILKI